VSPRFLSNVVLVLAGGFLVVASRVFSPDVVSWLALAIGLGVLALAGVAQLHRSRGIVQRVLDAAAGGLAIFVVVAAMAFTGTTLAWMAFAVAIGFAGLALVGLFAHEVSTERVVHSLDLSDVGRRRTAADRVPDAA
jgi:peptidoglycan/LPS O-acetylase OafA/YrhL